MKNNQLIYIHRFLKAFADAIIVVFIPLYILKESNQLNLSILYLISYSLFVMLFMFLFKKIIQKYGVITIILHFIPIIISEYILSLNRIDLQIVILVSSLMAIAQSFYSIPINLIFAFKDKNTDVARFQVASNIGKIIFTLASGLIISSGLEDSFLFLSIASSIFYITSVIPLFFSFKDIKEKYKELDMKEEKPKLDLWFLLFHITFGLFQPIMDNVVPLFLYVKGMSFQAVTYYIVIIEILKILSNFLAKFLISKHKEKICVTISMIVFLTSIIGICFIRNSIAVYVLSVLTSISFPLTFVPMFKLYCNKLLKENNVIYGITIRDFEIFAFRPLMYSTYFLGLTLYPCLIIGVIVVPLMYFSSLKLINNNK